MTDKQLYLEVVYNLTINMNKDDRDNLLLSILTKLFNKYILEIADIKTKKKILKDIRRISGLNCNILFIDKNNFNLTIIKD